MSLAVNPMQAVTLKQFGRKFHPSIPYATLRYWAVAGRKNRKTGALIKLATVYLPSGRSTSEEAYLDFIEKLNEVH